MNMKGLDVLLSKMDYVILWKAEKEEALEWVMDKLAVKFYRDRSLKKIAWKNDEETSYLQDILAWISHYPSQKIQRSSTCSSEVLWTCLRYSQGTSKLHQECAPRMKIGNDWPVVELPLRRIVINL